MTSATTAQAYDDLVWPPIVASGKAGVTALVQTLETTQWLPRQELEARQSEQLARLIAHHGRFRGFAERLRRAGLDASPVQGLDWLDRLPPLSRRDVQTAGQAFFASDLPRSHLPISSVKTSGSTGEPVTLRKTAVHGVIWAALAMRDHRWFKRDFRGRLTSIRANIFDYAETPNWGPPVADFAPTGRGQGIPITLDIAEQLRRIGKFDPSLLIVFPNLLAEFLTHWDRAGFRMKSLRHIKTIGETVSDILRVRTRQTTGLAIEDNYSSQEAGTIAIQCPESGLYHIMAEALIVEVLDAGSRRCGEGEVGRVVVTDLGNFASPLIRYDIGDFAEVGGPCPCGRGLPTLRRVLGRERNILMKPDGTRNWPRLGFYHFDEVLPVRQYQIVQTSLTEIEFRLVCDIRPTAEQADRLIKILSDSLEYPFSISIAWSRDPIPRGLNGKFEDFVCQVT